MADFTKPAGKKTNVQRFAEIPFFLILNGAYPALFLMAANRDQTSLASAGPTLLLAIAIAVLIGGLSLLIFRPAGRAYLAALVLNAALFAYGHLFNLLSGRELPGGTILRHWHIIPVFFLIAGGLLLWVLKRPAPRKSPVPALNALLLALCLLQVIPIAAYQLSASSPNTPAENSSGADNSSGPDIYYIILDSMPDADVLREVYGYSDYRLPEELAARGFIVPECAFSNYGSTATSITATFSLDYLDNLGIADEAVNNDTNDPPVLYNLLHDNPALAQLKAHGYTFAATRGFFPLNDFQEADLYFNFFEKKQGYDTLAERSFRTLFIYSTMLRIPSARYGVNPEAFPWVPKIVAQVFAPQAGVFSSRSYEWYQQHLYSFEKLDGLAALPEKTFTYAHLYTTHQPYVFQPDGSLLWPIQEDNNGFVAAARYTSRRILESIDHILSESSTPPVIILQADHGTGTGLQRHKILNAYYLPGVDPASIPATITPVNTLRLVLNEYAGGSYPMLPDIILYGEMQDPAPYTRFPAQCGLTGIPTETDSLP